MTARIGSLFTGMGGLDLAVEDVCGGRTVWHAEVEAAPSKILAARWPGVPNLGDVTRVDWAAVPAVDVICGGWPCQPFSSAGKRMGTDDPRALWPEVARCIRLLRPRLVVLENVSAVVAAGELERAANSLAALRYDIAWTCLRASDVGAPHRRERLFAAAWPTPDTSDVGHERRRAAWGRRDGSADRRSTAADTEGEGLEGLRPESAWSGPERGRLAATDTSRDGRDERRPEPARLERGSDAPQRGHAVAPDTDSDGRESLRRVHTVSRDTDRRDSQDTTWGDYEPAIRRWEHVLGRLAPPPAERAPKGGQRLSPRFVEWMQGLPDGWVTDIPGISRNDQLKALGNGVVPQQAAAALRLMLTGEAAA